MVTMENFSKSNLLRFCYIGESVKDFKQINHQINIDLLPIRTKLQSNLSKALFDLNRVTQRQAPQVIILNADLPGNPSLEFLYHYQKHISFNLPKVLFYISSAYEQPMDEWKRNFPFLTGLIRKPYLKDNFEAIATHLLNQFLPPLDLTIDLKS